MRRRLFLALALSLLPAAASLAAGDKTLHLAIGDPARRDREAPLVLDAITDTASGDTLTPEALPARLSGARILFVGESHTNADFHQVQLRVIQELTHAGRKVSIGLEMYPTPEQPFLDQWTRGLLTEEGFLTLSRWYESWGYPWPYYREIFLFARDHGLPLVALNAPREVVTAVRKKGLAGLSPEEAKHLPPRIDTENAEHQQLFRAFFEDGDAMHSGMSEEQWKTMFAAQCTWDGTMGYNAVQAARARQEEGAILVVLIGSGHVAFGLGIERQARLWFSAAEGGLASLIPVPVADDGGPVATVRASYASFLWGLPRETAPLYPSLGLSTAAVEGEAARKVIFVEEGSPAAAAGFAEGDVLLTMDGTPLPDKETFNRLLAGKRWGDAAVFTLRRGGETRTITALLRRTAE